MEEFYRKVYGGSCLEGEAMGEYLARAEDVLRRYERDYTVTESVENGRKLAICAMAEAIGYFETAQNGRGGMRYASVGTVSVSGKGVYSAVDISPKAQAQELYRCAGTYMNISRGKGMLTG